MTVGAPGGCSAIGSATTCAVAFPARHNGGAMADPLVTVSQRLAPAFAAVAGRPADPVVRPSDRADAQSNGALALAKELGRSPREVAQDVLAHAALDGVCSKVEIAGPGFVNLTFDDGFLAAELAVAAGDPHLGVRPAPTTQRVVIDYSAPNVAKEMHVGHLRSTVIGDSLARLAGFVGHDVRRENHIGDWGTPFGMLIEHLLDLGEAAAADELSVGDLNTFYQQARAKFDGDEAFKERARARVVSLQQGDAETLRLWRVLVAESTNYFNAVYRSLGVLLTDEDLAGESAYNELLPKVVERLAAAGLLVESEGAEVVFPPGFTNREGDPLPLIIRKGDGGYNYATTDLACVIDRIERIGASLLVYVVGAPQAQHLDMVFTVAAAAGWLVPPAQAVHVTFGSVLGEDRKVLKSRSGETVKLAALLDEAVERASAAVAEKNPDLPAAERAKVARVVGIGAVKYADLSTDRVKDYVFDWERMLSFDGNTAPYLQYAHARICSIFRRAELDRTSVRGLVPLLATAHERALALRLLQLDTAVWDSLERWAPHRLCTYLYDLATDFTAFYEHCPVLRADDEHLRASRLALCDLTARVLERGLGLLGIEAPEQM
jgi:arginyl-tRNA synthetase